MIKYIIKMNVSIYFLLFKKIRDLENVTSPVWLTLYIMELQCSAAANAPTSPLT